MSYRRRSVILGALGAPFISSVRAAPQAVKVTDHAGRPVEIGDTSRVVGIGGDVTEIIYALGAGDRLVGVDTTSLFPSEARQLPQVGYLRQLAAEGILSLRPSLVITTTVAGPATTLEQLRDAGVVTLVLPETHDFPGIVQKIERIGSALGRSDEARALADRKLAEMQALKRRLASLTQPLPRVLFLLAMGQGAPQAAGVRTAAEGIIRMARGRNAIDSYQGYRPVTTEGMLTVAPDVIMLTNETVHTLGGVDRVLGNEALQLTPAGKAKRVFTLDALLLLGFGPRTPEAVRHLAAFLYPAVDFPSFQ